MPKKKNKKLSKAKEVKGQLGKKKETAREKMIGQSIGYRYDVNHQLGNVLYGSDNIHLLLLPFLFQSLLQGYLCYSLMRS